MLITLEYLIFAVKVRFNIHR